jgi:ABC-type amino acid transport substrate-binding protein
MLSRILMAGALMLGLGCVMGDAQARSLDEIIKSGVVRIGINPNLPPMSAIGAKNEYEGFDVDIANRIAQGIGVKLELVPTETAQRVPYLTSRSGR